MVTYVKDHPKYYRFFTTCLCPDESFNAKKRRNEMITVHIKGGLGNQLFQYASAYALSQNLQQSLHLDTAFYHKQTLRGYKIGNLDIDNDIITTNICNSLMVRVINNKYINKLLRIGKFSVIHIE